MTNESDNSASDQGGDLEQSTRTSEPSARPRVKLRLWQEKFLVGLKEHHGNVNKAAVAANVSRRTAYQYKADDPDFAAAWDDVTEGLVDDVEENVVKLAKTGADPASAQFILKTRRKNIYGDKVEVTHSGTVGHVHTTPAELAARCAQMAPLLAAQVAKALPAKSEEKP